MEEDELGEAPVEDEARGGVVLTEGVAVGHGTCQPDSGGTPWHGEHHRCSLRMYGT